MPQSFSPLVDQLIRSLCYLPGVGPKSAQRMAFYLLHRHRDQGSQLAHYLQHAMQNIKHCRECRNFCETELCRFCTDSRRQPHLLCIVETPADVLAIEQTSAFHGMYFVLMGHLSPLDGIGPDAIGIDLLHHRLQQGTIQEIILATNPTVEGEATAHYIADLAKQYGIRSSRIAHGVPLGSELEFIDSGTLARALDHRGEIA
ncbi:MAG: recombination mediator RecR [Gammaproteobacteria bacterium]